MSQVVIFSRHFPPAHKSGGPARSLGAMVSRASDPGNLTIITSATDLDGSTLPGVASNQWSRWAGARIFYNAGLPQFVRLLLQNSHESPRAVYINSVFDPYFAIIPSILFRFGKWHKASLNIAPRGEFALGALALKSRKKKAFIAFARAFRLYDDCTWYASSLGEMYDIVRLFPLARVKIRPNDALLPDESTDIAPEPRPFHLTFIGRISPVKGLDILLEALRRLESPPAIEVNILGTFRADEEAYNSLCKAIAADLPACIKVIFRGALPPTEVIKTLSHSNLMALPTAGENFGHAIAEALSTSCPVMIPPVTPWTSAAAASGTLVPDRSVESWASAISKYLAKSPPEMTEDRLTAAEAYAEWRTRANSQPSVLDEMQGPRQVKSIAIVTQGYESAGGVQTVARWIREALAERGIETTVYDLASSAVDARSHRLARPVSWRKPLKLQPSPNEAGVYHVGAHAVELEFMRYLPRTLLTKELNRHDAVQIVSGGPALALATLFARPPSVLQMATCVRWERKSIIAKMSGPKKPVTRLMTSIVSVLEPASLRTVKAVMVENNEAEDLVRRLAPRAPVKVAPPGVNTEAYFANQRGWNSSGPIVSVGRLNDPRKGFIRMLDAYSELLRARPHCPKLVIIGRGDPTSLIKAAQDLGIDDSVQVDADLDIDDLRSQLRSASVFWQTSFEEGLGIAVIEAMASGVPVVCTRTAGTDMTVLNGVTGYLAPQETVEMIKSFIDSTISVLDERGDEFSRASRERAVTHFSTGVTIDLFVYAYQNLVEP